MQGRLNLIDRAVAWVSPGAGVRRLQARHTLARYEAARPSKTRGHLDRSTGTGEALVSRDAATVRAIARALERDHDVARGALAKLSSVIVGPTGISIEPQPRTADDTIHDDFARQLLRLYADWVEAPEVTGTMDWAMVQDMACRAWLRDGEIFAQAIEGPVPYLDHHTTVPFSLELLEADMCPLEYQRERPRIEAGIERNDWGRPIGYYLWKEHPGAGAALIDDVQLKRVAAERMLHASLRDRFSGLRGMSVFASVVRRLEDVKDYEDSERIAARIAAAIAAYIKRDKDMLWTAPEEDSAAASYVLRMAAGSILDRLAPGEEIQMLHANRPNVALAPFVEHNYRSASCGVNLSASSFAHHYDGNFSAQRQELVESWVLYRTMTARFAHMFVRPTWRRLVRTAIAAGLLKVPAEVRPDTIFAAAFRGPAMPWIDPKKEAEGLRLLVRSGFATATEVVAERGGRVQDTYEMLKRERELADELGLTLECDAATKGSAAGSSNLDGAAVDDDNE